MEVAGEGGHLRRTVRWAPATACEEPRRPTGRAARRPGTTSRAPLGRGQPQRRGQTRPPRPRPACRCAVPVPGRRRRAAATSVGRMRRRPAPRPRPVPPPCGRSARPGRRRRCDAARSMNVAACTASVKTRAVSLVGAHRLDHRVQRLHHAGLVVGQHDGHQRRGRRRPASAKRVHVDHARRVDRRLRTSAPRACAAAARHDSRTAGCSTAELTTDTARPGRSPHRRHPSVPEDGQVGRLGAAGGEDDVAGVAAQVQPPPRRGTPRAGGGPVAPDGGSRSGCPAGRPGLGHGLAPPRAAAVWWPRGRDTS